VNANSHASKLNVEVNMPPWILAALPAMLAAFTAVTTGALVLGPFLIPLWRAQMSELQRQRILAAVKGANDTLGPIVKSTPNWFDDRLLAISQMVERELGKVDAAKVNSVANSFVNKVAR
jgi:hypothetical protein